MTPTNRLTAPRPLRASDAICTRATALSRSTPIRPPASRRLPPVASHASTVSGGGVFVLQFHGRGENVMHPDSSDSADAHAVHNALSRLLQILARAVVARLRPQQSL